jgi:sugar fermentation stimulation protein A
MVVGTPLGPGEGWRAPLPELAAAEPARFLRRLNRFVAEVEYRGRIQEAHLPNPGRLWELLSPGVPLFVLPGRVGGLPLRVVGTERMGRPVLLDTGQANDAAERLLRASALPGLEGARILRREAACGESRFDFLLERDGRPLWLEVKSCTLFGRRGALFPDAPSERARKHLKGLAALPPGEGGVLILVQRGATEWFLPDYHTDPAFSAALRSVRDRVEIRVAALDWDEGFRLASPPRVLPIPWEILEREDRDSGIYLAILRLDGPARIAVGSLGEIDFDRGHWVYVGSARRGLAARLARHGRARKALHWHIDYLRESAAFVRGIPIRTSDPDECGLARAVGELARASDSSDPVTPPCSRRSSVPGFGCSDCGCPSHLFRFDEDPIRDPRFVELLLRFRVDRLDEFVSLSDSAPPVRREEIFSRRFSLEAFSDR